MPKVSILLPVYNGARFIDTTIGCLLNQSFRDFEIIACDDSSTDNSWEVLQKWARDDSRIRLIRHDVNKGVFETQKELAAQARGEFIAQQDQDDYSAPERLQVQVEILTAHPEASGTVSNVWMVDEEGDPVGVTNIPATAESLAQAMRHENVCFHSSLMMRRTAVEKIGGYSREADHVADYDLMLRLLNQGPLIPSPLPLATYGLSPGTVTYRDRATQVALAKEIRHRYFQTPKPDKTHYPPVSLEQARANYHYEVGKMYLAKANTTKARQNLRESLKQRPSFASAAYYAASHLPAGAIRLIRRLKGNPNEQEFTYFLKR